MVALKFEITEAKVWYLEMVTPPNAMQFDKPGVDFVSLPKPVTVERYRKYYFGVGEKWNWLDRMVMPDEELSAKINASGTDIFLLKVNGTDAGYVELVNTAEFSEIGYFGLLPGFIGKGYGKYFLQWGIHKAWSYGAKKVQLNTCSLDHPDALSIYKSCGFKVVRTQVEKRKILIPC
jgi:GNAT superfamily N-acetyltransferase